MPQQILCHNEPVDVENFVLRFRQRYEDLPVFVLDANELLLRKTVKVIDTVNNQSREPFGLTLLNVRRLMNNECGHGREMVQCFYHCKAATPEETSENANIANWFLNEYFVRDSKIFHDLLPMRTYVAYLLERQEI